MFINDIIPCARTTCLSNSIGRVIPKDRILVIIVITRITKVIRCVQCYTLNYAVHSLIKGCFSLTKKGENYVKDQVYTVTFNNI